MDRLLDLSKNSLQYGNSMCPSMIRKLKLIVYFRKVFLLSKFKYVCFVTILDMSLISRSCKNDHIIFNVGTPSLEAINIRLVNIITYIIEESYILNHFQKICRQIGKCHSLLNFVSHATSFMYFRHFYIDSLRPKKGSSPRIFMWSRNLEYLIVFINFYFI